MSEKSKEQGVVSTIPTRPHYTKLEDRYEMQVVIPADIPQEAIELNVEEENVLTVRGRAEYREMLPVGESGEEKEDVYYSTFERSVRLPSDGNLKEAKTHLESISGDNKHCLLKVQVPMMR